MVERDVPVIAKSLALELINELEEREREEHKTLQSLEPPRLYSSRVKVEEPAESEAEPGVPQAAAPPPAPDTTVEPSQEEETAKKEEEEEGSSSEKEQADYERDSPEEPKQEQEEEDREYEDPRVKDFDRRRVGVDEARDTEEPPVRREHKGKSAQSGGKNKGKSKGSAGGEEKHFTVVCRHYMRARGGCRRGDKCTYIHGFAEAGRSGKCYSCGDPDNWHRREDCPTLKMLSQRERDDLLRWHPGPKGKKGSGKSREQSVEDKGRNKSSPSTKGKGKKGSKEGKTKQKEGRSGSNREDSYSYEYYSNYDSSCYEDSEQNPEGRRSSEEERPRVRLTPKEPDEPPPHRKEEASEKSERALRQAAKGLQEGRVSEFRKQSDRGHESEGTSAEDADILPGFKDHYRDFKSAVAAGDKPALVVLDLDFTFWPCDAALAKYAEPITTTGSTAKTGELRTTGGCITPFYQELKIVKHLLKVSNLGRPWRLQLLPPTDNRIDVGGCSSKWD